MTTRYYAETPCEECGEPVGEHDGPYMVGHPDGCEGSGGTRRELTIDYAVAERIYNAWWLDVTNPHESDHEALSSMVRRAVDAALSTESGDTE